VLGGVGGWLLGRVLMRLLLLLLLLLLMLLILLGGTIRRDVSGRCRACLQLSWLLRRGD